MQINIADEATHPDAVKLKRINPGAVVIHNHTLYLVGSNGSINEPACTTTRNVLGALREANARILMSLAAGTTRVVSYDTYVIPVRGIKVAINETLPDSVLRRLEVNPRSSHEPVRPCP